TPAISTLSLHDALPIFCFIVSISISRTVFCSSPAEVVPATSAGADALGEAARAAFFSAGNVGSASSQDTATSSAISGGIVLRWVRNPNVKQPSQIRLMRREAPPE